VVDNGRVNSLQTVSYRLLATFHLFSSLAIPAGDSSNRSRIRLWLEPTIASKFYQLKMRHCLTGQFVQWTTRRPDANCW